MIIIINTLIVIVTWTHYQLGGVYILPGKYGRLAFLNKKKRKKDTKSLSAGVIGENRIYQWRMTLVDKTPSLVGVDKDLKKITLKVAPFIPMKGQKVKTVDGTEFVLDDPYKPRIALVASSENLSTWLQR